MSVRLRSVRENDRDQMLEWRNRTEVARWMFGDRAITAEEHAAWFPRMLCDDGCRYWIIEDDGVGLGVASVNGIDRRNKRCAWSFYLADTSNRGRGIGSAVEWLVIEETFGPLALDKLCGECLASNELVLNMHMGFGFQVEGRLVRHMLKDGILQDVVLIALFREDWLRLRDSQRARLLAKGIAI